MDMYHKVILLFAVVLGLILPCGCSKKQNAPAAPVPLVIYTTQTSPYNFENLDLALVRGRFAACDINIVLEEQIPARRAAPNEMFVWRKEHWWVNEGGKTASNEDVGVAEVHVRTFLEAQIDDPVAIDLGVAAVCAHEIGHALLGTGSGVHEADVNNIMHNSIADWIPLLEMHRPPVFNEDQIRIIRKKLGYPEH